MHEYARYLMKHSGNSQPSEQVRRKWHHCTLSQNELPAHCAVLENIHTSPTEGQWKFQGGGGGKGKRFKRKVWSYILEFLERWGGGCIQENLLWGGHGYYFTGTTHSQKRGFFLHNNLTWVTLSQSKSASLPGSSIL